MAENIKFEWLMDAHVRVFRPVQVGNIPLGFEQGVPIGDGFFEGP